MSDHPERQVWRDWLDKELETYVDPKFDSSRPGHDHQLVAHGTGRDSYWFEQVMQYPHRASVLGLVTPAGRQALLKGLAAYTAMVESMIRMYGDPPEAGHPSGVIR